MAVYVGPIKPTKPSRKWPWDGAATMYADRIEDLHRMAALCGIGKHWFRDDARLRHYLLSPRGRGEAIKQGAVAVDGHAVEARIAGKVEAKGRGPGVERVASTLFGEPGRML